MKYTTACFQRFKNRRLGISAKILALSLGLSAVGIAPLAHASNTWDGGGADAFWATATNWSDDIVPVSTAGLTFNGTLNQTNTNNLFADGTTLGGGLVFGTTGFNISGAAGFNNLILGGNITTSVAAVSTTINLNLGLGSANRSIINTNGTGTFTITGVISDGGATARGLTIGSSSTGGNVNLSGPNTFSGGLSLTRGSVAVATIGDQGAAGPVGTGAVNLVGSASAANFNYNGAGETNNRQFNVTSATAGVLSITQAGASGTLTLNGAITATANRTLTLAGSTAGTAVIGGAITDGANTLAINKTGTGTWTLSGANTYKGTTTVSAGILTTAAGGGNLGTGNVTLVNVSGAALTLGNIVSIADNAILTIGTTNSTVNMSFVGTEILGDITNGMLTASTGLGPGTYSAAQLNAFFGSTRFVDTDTVGDAFFAVTAVPEPGTWATMLGVTAALTGLWRSRRRAN